MEHQSPLTLLQFNEFVGRAVRSTFGNKKLWLVAEVGSITENRGHCYIDLVQKASSGDSQLLARARAIIWRDKWPLLRTLFERATNKPLSPGMQVLVEATPTLSALYGYSINITNIDPAYTLGDLARRRQEILRILQAEGVLHLNKQLPLPRLLQRIAVISAPNAAGYQDFCRQLQDNPHHLAFQTQLFPAVMQGDRVEPTVIAALDTIAEQRQQWDAVVIIRGGGAALDLSGFDTLSLAEHVANFPLPIITGIGHERDDTIVDLVAHTRVKTPTAAAEFLITHQKHELDTLNSYLLSLTSYLLPHISNRQRLKLNQLIQTAQHAAQLKINAQQTQLNQLSQRARWATAQWLNKQKNQLDLAENTLRNADPQHLLRLGYSITRLGGHAITSTTQLQPGDQLTTTLANGTIHSTVNTPS